MPIDMSAAVKPPARKTSTSRATSSSTKALIDVKTPSERRVEGLNGLGQLAQGLCLMMGQYADAAAIGQHFSPIATELASVAEENETVAKPIDFLISVGPYGALIQACIPFAMQLLANHRLIKADAMIGSSVVPPEVLEAQMKAQVMRMQAEAMRDQQKALAEAQAAQREMENLMRERQEMAAA